LIEIELEDAILGVIALDLERHARFAQLAGEPRESGPLAAVDLLGPEVAGELHRDGRETLLVTEQGGLDRAEHPDPIDAVVVIEAAILDGQKRRGDRRGDLLQRNDRAALIPEVG